MNKINQRNVEIIINLKLLKYFCFRVNFATCIHPNNVCINMPCNVLPDPEKDTKALICEFYADERYDPNKSKRFYQSCTKLYTVHCTPWCARYMLHLIHNIVQNIQRKGEKVHFPFSTIFDIASEMATGSIEEKEKRRKDSWSVRLFTNLIFSEKKSE